MKIDFTKVALPVAIVVAAFLISFAMIFGSIMSRPTARPYSYETLTYRTGTVSRQILYRIDNETGEVKFVVIGDISSEKGTQPYEKISNPQKK